MANLEDAIRCPKCDKPGYLFNTRMVKSPRTGRKESVHIYKCDNKLCLWYDTGWTVQISDGQALERARGGIKSFEPLTPGQATRARDILRDTDSTYNE